MYEDFTSVLEDLRRTRRGTIAFAMSALFIGALLTMHSKYWLLFFLPISYGFLEMAWASNKKIREYEEREKLRKSADPRK